jgi:hypothetical protein
MGIFSSKKKTYVSSVVYNLAGPIQDRPDYLKSVILSSLLTEKKFKPAKVIQGAYTGGMGLRLRGYHRWSRDNFKQVGIPTDRIYGKRNLSAEVIAAILLADYEITAEIDWIDTGGSEIEMWGRQWMRENLPLKEQTDTWRVDFIEATREAMIVFSDGMAPVVFKPAGYREGGDWLYVSYSRPLSTNRWTTPQLFIYQRGTGSTALDAQFNVAGSTGEYLPFIPFRHENKFISESYKPELYAEVQKAYKKAVGQKFEDLIDKIKENPDLGEIDFAYVFFGTSFNTKDMASRRYMYHYFKHLQGQQLIGASAYNSWAAGEAQTRLSVGNWLAWYLVQTGNPAGSPRVGAEPDRPAVTSAPVNSVIIEDRGPGQTNLKMEIKWNSIEIGGGVGLGKPDAKKGDVWFTFAGGQTIVASAYTNDEVENLRIDTIEAYHQVSANSWEKLIIRGMTHINHIYNGKTVETTAAQALVDEDESGFLIPIHYEVYRQMSLVDATQMGTQCVNLVFNCYTIVKKKWYQSGWFKVLLVIVVIVLTVVTGGTFGPAGVGILGTSAGVGAALGFSGLAALIAGTIANMVAAMIITKLITVASVAILGEKIGMIVAAVASFVVLQIGAGMQSGQSLASALSNFTSPMNLLNLTSSVGNAYAGVIQQDTMEIMKKSAEALDDFREQSLKLQENYAEQFGYGSAVFDPMSLTQAGQSFFAEPSETFLSRTLLTGSEIAQMGNEMITNFVELTLRNEFSDED